MAKNSEALQNIRRKVMAENLVNQSADQNKKLVDALEVVPQKKMLDDAQYLLNDLLPRLIQKKGDQSDEYKFFRGLVDTIMWALFIMERYENLLSKYQYSQLICQMFKEKMEVAEKELLKYMTVEDLTLADTLKDVQAAIMKRSEEWINSIIEKK